MAMSDSYFTDLPTIYNLPSSGNSILTSGPDNRGLDFGNDTDFGNAGVGVGANNYMVLFSGSFNAKTTGNYNWEIYGNDDRGTLWFDLDGNGIFQSTGQFGNEQILDSTAAFDNTTNLNQGFYKFALLHGESSGESSQSLKFSTPSGAGPTTLTMVKPDDAQQSELFLTENEFSLLKGALLVLHWTEITP